MAGCCVGATEIFSTRVGDDEAFTYELRYDVTGLKGVKAPLTLKNCGCILLHNPVGTVLAKFEPELCWRNVMSGSLYTWEKLAESLSNYDLKEFGVGLVEEWTVQEDSTEEDNDPHTAIYFSQDEIDALQAGSTVVFDGVEYKMLGTEDYTQIESEET